MGISTQHKYSAPRKSFTSTEMDIDPQSNSEEALRSPTITGIKSTVTELVRGNLSRLAPANMRLRKLPTKGFVMPSDPYESSLRSSLNRQRSVRSTHSRTTIRSKASSRSRMTMRTGKSVYSVRSVKRVGSTPSIIVTQPTNRGRRIYAIHRGQLVYTPVAPRRRETSSNRYYRQLASSSSSPVVSKKDIIATGQLAAPSQPAGLAYDSGLGTSKDASTHESSHATNVFELEGSTNSVCSHSEDNCDKDASLDFSNKEAILDIDFDRYKFVVNLLSDKDFAFDPTVKQVIDQSEIGKQPLDSHARKHRHDAFMTLCGGADTQAGCEPDEAPAKIVSRPKSYARDSTQSATFTLPAEGGTFFDDRSARKSYVPESSVLYPPKSNTPNVNQQQDQQQLQYLAYSPSVKLSTPSDRNTNVTLASQDPWHKRVDSAQSSNLRQLYDRIDKLEDGLDKIDGSLQSSIQQAIRAPSIIMDALPAVLTRPPAPARLVDINRPRVPKHHTMLDNGFPILNPSVESFSAEPMYAKRILTGDELKALQKQERRKAAMENPEKKSREYNRGKKVKKATRPEDMPLINRMLAKLSFKQVTE